MFRMMKWSYNAQLQSTRSNKNFVLLLRALGTDSASSSPFQTPRYSIVIILYFTRIARSPSNEWGKMISLKKKIQNVLAVACNYVSCSSNPDHQITNQNAFGEVA